MTARDQVASRVAGLDLGADDDVAKPFDIDELAARMRALCCRATGRPQPMPHHGALVIDPLARTVTVAGAVIELSARGFDVLRVLVEASPRVLSRAHIEADALRAGAVMGELLAPARASRAEISEGAQALDLAQLAQPARRVTGEFAQVAIDSGHELAVSGDETMPIQGHALLLELAPRNLIENALGHRVVDTVARTHDGHFGRADPPAGFTTGYRLRPRQP